MTPYDPETTRLLCDLILAEARQVTLATIERMEALRNRFHEHLHEGAFTTGSSVEPAEGIPWEPRTYPDDN